MKLVESLRTDTTEQRLTEFFHHCVEVFSYDWRFKPSFGGPKWRVIANAPLQLLRGEMPLSVFIDHVFDLRHNTAMVFNKHECLYSQTIESRLQYQLNEKKRTTNVSELFNCLQQLHPKFTDEDILLFLKGQQARV